MRALRLLSSALLWIALGALCAQAPFAFAADPQVKNLIILIGDGCGFNHLEAADDYQNGEAGHQPYQKEFTPLAVSTFPAGGAYDPKAAWSDWEYVRKGATDSAAAATAMATGIKTKNGVIAYSPDQKPVEHTTDRAEKHGKATGVITTVPLCHATPAAFVASNPERGNYAEIAQEMILKSSLDVIMGAGHPWFDDDGKPTATLNGDTLPDGVAEEKYRYVGGSALWQDLLKGAAGGDADGDGQPDPWKLIQAREEFRALGEGDAPKRLFGVAQVASTLQKGRKGHDDDQKDDAPFETPLTESVPTLAEMTAAALNVLDNDPDGFFLMVEGGAIDWASHANQLGRAIEEAMSFTAAIETVVQWVEAHSNWNETLVLITADHETGYLWGPGSNPEWKPLQNNGKGKMPGATWNQTSHTNSLVPFFVRGKGAEAFVAAATGEDPRRGKYLDNTDIGKISASLMGE